MADQTPNMSQQTAKPTTPAVSTPSPAPGSGPTISSSASTSSSRPYVPQFSAATQLILQRLKAKDGKNDGSGNSFSSVVSSKTTTVVTGSSPTIKLEQDAFEDAKKRLVAGTGLKTSTSMSLKMPLIMPSIKVVPTPSPTTTTTTTIKSLPLPMSVSAASRTGSSSTTTSNLSLPLPPPPPPKHKSLTFKNNTTSAIKNINSGLTASGKVSVVKAPKPASSSSSTTTNAAAAGESKPKKAKTSTGNPVGRPSNASKAAAAAAAAAALAAVSDATTGHRKKRIKQQQQDIDEISSLSSLSDISEHENASSSTPSGAAAALLTMTKSGRQVLKPTTYNPAAVDAANKKHRNSNALPTHGQYGGKRTADQALCKKCTRMHSPASNPMVFCDGCNEGWHQRCHDPFIPSEVIRDQTRSWICSVCVAKREKHLTKKQQKLAAAEQQQQQQQQVTRTSWADKPPQQKRAYLSTLPPQELVGLIMAALEVHPDLPIFPGPPKTNNSSSNGSGKGQKGPNGKSLKDIMLSREPSQEENGGEDEEEYDPLAALWPKPGSGLYSLLPLNDADDDEYLVDSNDFEAFSSIVYDDRGRKVLENGLRV